MQQHPPPPPPPHSHFGHGGGPGQFSHDPLQAQILRSRSMDELSAYILSHNGRFNECHISTAINKFWKFRQDRERDAKRRSPLRAHEAEALKRLFDLALERDFQPRQASTIVKAIGNGGFHLEDARGVEVVKKIVNSANLHTYRALEISHCVEAVTALKLMDQSDFFANVHDCLTKRSLRDFNAVDISGILYGFAYCCAGTEEERRAHLPVFELFAKELATRDFSAGGDSDSGKLEYALSRVTAILTSFALVGYLNAPSTVLQNLVDVANRRMRDLKLLRCSEVANLFWACTVLGKADALIVGKELEYRTLKYFNTMQIASLLWSAVCSPPGTLGTERFYSNVCAELRERKFAELDLDTLVMLCWALARTKLPSALIVFGILASEITLRRWEAEYSKSQLVMLAWSFSQAAKLSGSPSATIVSLPQRLKQRLVENAGELTPREICVLARVTGKDDDLFLPNLRVVDLEEGAVPLFTDEEWIDTVYFGVERTFDGLQQRALQVDVAALQSALHISRFALVIARAGWNSMDKAMLQIASRVTAGEAGEPKQWSLANLARLLLAFTELQFYHAELFAFALKQAVLSQPSYGVGEDVLAAPATTEHVLIICWALLANGLISPDLVQLLTMEAPPTSEQALLLHECKEAWMQRFPDAALPKLLQVDALQGNGDELVAEEMVQLLRREELGFAGARREESGAGPQCVVRISSNVVIVLFAQRGGGAGEVSGPSSLYLEDGVSLRGSADFTKRLWENRGFWVVPVRTSAWEEMGQEAKLMFLEAKLKALEEQQ